MRLGFTRRRLTTDTSVSCSPISVLDQFQLSLNDKSHDDKLIFCVDSESLRDRWAEELAKAVAFLNFRQAQKKSAPAARLESADTDTDTDTENEIENENDDNNGVELSQLNVDFQEDFDEMNLDDFQNDDPGSLCKTNSNFAMLELELEAKKNYPIQRRILKHRKRVMQKKLRVLEGWRNITFRFILLGMGREGKLPRIKRWVEKISLHGCSKSLQSLLDASLNNVARSAVQLKHVCLYKWLIENYNIDVNNQNRLGIPLLWFAIMPKGSHESALETMEYLIEQGADVHAKNNVGANVLYFAVMNEYELAVKYMEYFEKVHGFDLKIVDKFGCSLLHWAAFHNNANVAKYLFDHDHQVFSRAKWNKVMELYARFDLLPPTATQARTSWRARGLMKFTNNASPLTVAILHNNGDIAKLLMGLNSTSCECLKRKNLFSDNNVDLEIVAAGEGGPACDVSEICTLTHTNSSHSLASIAPRRAYQLWTEEQRCR